MVAEAPAASKILAQSLTVTILVIHWTRGAFSRTAASMAAKSIRSMPLTA